MVEDKVSVIIPVYNTEPYLRRCVKSVLDQSYNNVEIILVEDGSGDSSLQVCEELAAENSMIKLIKHKTNCGQEKTRNDGIEMATGQWILFLDSDDMISEDAISRLVDSGKRYNSDLVFFNFMYVQDGLTTIVKPSISEGVFNKTEFVSKLLQDISWALISCIGSKLYKADCLRAHKLKYEIKYKFNEDGAFALKAINNASIISYVDYDGYHYILRNANSVQSSYRKNLFSTVRNVHVLMKDIFEQNNCIQTCKQRLYLQQILFIYVCLKNEVDYNDYKSYSGVFETIKNDSFYCEACRNISVRTSIPKWFFAKSFLLKLKLLVYLMIKSRR